MKETSVSAPKPVMVDNSELKPLRQASPSVPESMAELSGEVEIEFLIDHKGYVAEAKVLTATAPALGELARLAALKWKFTPIVRNGVAVPVKAVQPFRFGQGTVAIAKIDRLPEVRNSVAPELPASLEGASGFANILFEVDAQGHVTAVEAKESSHEDFKTAALAAAKQWTFKPALRAGVPVAARVVIPFVFGKK
jgi:TonB family protein